MKLLLSLITLAASAAASAASSPSQPSTRTNDGPPEQYGNTSSSTACSDIHYIVARASLEPPGQGLIGSLATLSSTLYPGSSVEAIKYPALLYPYASSSYNGTLELTRRLKDYVDKCDKAKIVLLGYSQGAHVVGDVLCGGGGDVNLGPDSEPIAKKYADKVVAMVQMGDPRFVMKKSFDVGTATLRSAFPRPQNISCDQYADRIRSYCDANDPFCANGGDLEVHLTYNQRYNKAASDFIKERLMKAGVKTGAGSGNTSMNAAAAQSQSSVLVLLSLVVVSIATAW